MVLVERVQSRLENLSLSGVRLMDRDQMVESIMRASTGYTGPLPSRRSAAGFAATAAGGVGSSSMNGRRGLDRAMSRSFSKSGSIRRATDTNIRRATDTNIDYQAAPAPPAIRQMPERSVSSSVRRSSDTNVEVSLAQIQTGRPFPMMPRMRASDSNVHVGQGGRTPSIPGPSTSSSIGGNGSGRGLLFQPVNSSEAPVGRYSRRTLDNLLESVTEERAVDSPTGGDASQPR